MTTQILKTAQIIPPLEKIKGCKFASFIYKAKGTGEVSKVIVSLNISYENAKLRDLDKLNNFAPNSDLQNVAKGELIQSLIAPDKSRSTAQKEAREAIIPNMLYYFPETGNISVWGMVIKKEILEVGEYKTVKSRPLTVEKNKIKKQLDFRTAKFRLYIIQNITNISIQGETLFIE